MIHLHKPKTVTLPDGLTTSPVEGHILGELRLQFYSFFPFACIDLVYVGDTTSAYFFLKGVSTDLKYEIILSGPHTLEEGKTYRIGEETGDVQAQFYIYDDDYEAYSPASGSLTVTTVEQVDEYQVITANTEFDFVVFDKEDVAQKAKVIAHEIRVNTRPLKKKAP
ncbi:hypothetical protein HF257_11770 [Pseudomonas sp. WS 5106]|uniref:Uncharacterized protein n=1 Tax=Pseudomonas cremoris TaxID=2724178 RepID=A0A7X1ALR5_9PSED|nr:hypothetical protein [Pseudomonas cremoris]MBC2381540.1 hypothetical protein [Pseudomonas cremoris]MBC2406049.1 hypothetical protein [Pseudomonas cremoris]MBC2406685.1 hypothetical protein [Pseudomonas cremoris]